MTDQRLHDLLHELGDTQPPVRVDPLVFRRGRRAHRRTFVAATASALAAVAIVGGLATTVLDNSTALPADGHSLPAIPTHVYAVPERLVEFQEQGFSWGRGRGERDLAVGRASVAVSSPGPVVITATDGVHHLLELPGYDWRSNGGTDAPTMALSPDGRRLAYGWYLDPDPMDDAHVPSGVRIVDLETGEITSLRDDRGYGVIVAGFGWSPDGRYLAYSKKIRTSPNGTSGARNFFVERLDTRTGRAVRVDGIQGSDYGLGVSDDGWIATGSPGKLVTPGGEARDVRMSWASNAVWSPDGRRFAVGSVQNGTISVVSRSDGTSQRLVAGGGTVQALGWAGDGRVAALYLEGETAQLELLDTRGDRQQVATLDRDIPITAVTVATELLDRPTRAFAEPNWPFDPESLVVPGLITGVVAVGLAAAFASERRRRRGLA